MIPTLVYLDRYRNEGTRVYSPHAAYTEARDRYRPTAPHEAFRLPVFRLPPEEVNLYEAAPLPELRDRYVGNDGVLFCVHPQVLEELQEDPYVRRIQAFGRREEPLRVVPSSSTRTLYVMPGHGPGPDLVERTAAEVRRPLPSLRPSLTRSCPTQALKVHFPFRISRYGRRMRDEVIRQAINVSREIEERPPAADHDFAFLREVLGVSLRNQDPDSPRGENWGYLIRDMTPFPVLEGTARLIPGFALYGRDLHDPTLPPLILELLGDEDPVDFLLGAILLPVVRHWVRCYLELGFILEPHGQNVLLETSNGDRIRRVVHRDLSPGIDMRRRRGLGLGSSGLNDYNRMEDGRFASIAYDKMMGGHFFDRLLEPVLAAFPRLRPDDVRGPCRDEFRRLFPDHGEFLPRTVHYFDEERDEFGKPGFLDTGATPGWRP